MKQNMKGWVGFFGLSIVLFFSSPTYAAEGGVILNPGTLSGSVTLEGYQITSVTVRAIDTNKELSATVSASASGGAASIDYTLTLEGGKDYYVMAEVYVLTADNTNNRVVIPKQGPLTVAVGSDVPLDFSMEPAIISGTISTGDAADTIASYNVYAYFPMPEFEQTYYSRTSPPSSEPVLFHS